MSRPESEPSLLKALASPGGTSAALRLLADGEVENGSERERRDVWRSRLREEWASVGPAGSDLVPALVEILTGDTDLITMEVVSLALATQGEDGAGALLELLGSEDFSIRHKAAVGFGILDRSARWAVPALLRALEVETQPLIVCNLADALGRIGGGRAIQGLGRMLEDLGRARDSDRDRCSTIEAALKAAIVGRLLEEGTP